MDSEAQTPGAATWFLVAIPVLAMVAYEHPVFQAALGIVMFVGGGYAAYRIVRWLETLARRGRG